MSLASPSTSTSSADDPSSTARIMHVPALMEYQVPPSIYEVFVVRIAYCSRTEFWIPKYRLRVLESSPLLLHSSAALGESFFLPAALFSETFNEELLRARSFDQMDRFFGQATSVVTRGFQVILNARFDLSRLEELLCAHWLCVNLRLGALDEVVYYLQKYTRESVSASERVLKYVEEIGDYRAFRHHFTPPLTSNLSLREDAVAFDEEELSALVAAQNARLIEGLTLISHSPSVPPWSETSFDE